MDERRRADATTTIAAAFKACGAASRGWHLAVLTRFTQDQLPAYWRLGLGPLIAKRQAEYGAAVQSIAERLFAKPPNVLRRRFVAHRIANARVREIRSHA
ncbi:MAG TPA: hypothetical protein VNL39_11765 [Xanthobacteraceae bacterium]|nr:hypothetical protein [Xanthobacteraceae bacterium]